MGRIACALRPATAELAFFLPMTGRIVAAIVLTLEARR